MKKPPSPFVPLKIDPDKLASASAAGVANAATRIVDRVQTMPEEQRILGVACAFSIFCKVYDLNPRDLAAMSGRVMSAHDARWKPEFRAIRDFAARKKGVY